MWVLWTMVLTFSSIGVAHIVGSTVRVTVWVGSGSIYSNELAPVHLQNILDNEKDECVVDDDYG